MYSLKNRMLTVTILDPVDDRPLLGSRYCTGGYLWQITSSHGSDLLSGPKYPVLNPPVYDGQGAPEAFVIPLGDDAATIGAEVTVIGVGVVHRSTAVVPFIPLHNPIVSRFCTWRIKKTNNSIVMTTAQESGTSSCRLTRRICLNESTVISETVLTNTASSTLPLRWFPHPFFPLNRSGNCCSLSCRWDLEENKGYQKTAGGILKRKSTYQWDQGLFLPLHLLSTEHFAAQCDHPEVSNVNVVTNYAPDELPVWANSATFSPEPYLVRLLFPQTTSSWSITYRFGV